jgi:hypothetical protein
MRILLVPIVHAVAAELVAGEVLLQAALMAVAAAVVLVVLVGVAVA